MKTSWAARVRRLKGELYALYFAYRDPRTPWHARIVTAIVVGYAFSPSDLIPDFIPILGYLDDLLLVPLGIYIAIRLIPDEVLADSRRLAQGRLDEGKPVSRAAAVVVVLIWLGAAVWGGLLLLS